MALTTLAKTKEYLGIPTATTTYDDLLTDLIDRASNAIEVHCGRIFEETTYRDFYDGDGQSELTLRNNPVIGVRMLGVGNEDAFGVTNSSSDAYNAQVTVTDTTIQLEVMGGTNEDNTPLTLATYTTLTALITAIEALDKGWSATVADSLAVWSAVELLPTGKGLQCLAATAYPQIPSEPESDYTTDNRAGILKYFGAFGRGFQNIIVRYTAGYATIPGDLQQICIDLVKVYYDSSGDTINSNMKKEKIGDYEYETGGTAQLGATSTTGIPSTIAGRLTQWSRWSL